MVFHPFSFPCRLGSLLCLLLALRPAPARGDGGGWPAERTLPPARLTLEAALDRVVTTDQTVAIADFEVRKAAVDQLRAWTRVLPSLGAGADTTWRGSRRKDEIEALDTGANQSDPLGAGAGGTTLGRAIRVLDLKTNELQREQDGLRVGDTRRSMAEEVAAAWYAIDELRKTADSLQAEREAAEAAYPVQQGKYRAGLATNLEVQSAIRDLARVRAEAVVNAYDLEVAYRELENVLSLYQNDRIEAALDKLFSRPEPRFLEPLDRNPSPGAPDRPSAPSPPRAGRK